MTVWRIALIVIAAGFIDFIIKELIIKRALRYETRWSELPEFWKDKIPNDNPFRIRWAYVLNVLFLVAAGLVNYMHSAELQHSWKGFVVGSGMYLFLISFNWEHIIYQWFRTFPRFDLHDNPGWMDSIPWNRWLAKVHGKQSVTSEEIYFWGMVSLVIVLYFWK